MHGLINRAIQCFTRDTYGEDCWMEVVRRAGLETPRFEAMLSYPDAQTWQVLAALTQILDKSEAALLEDIGTYLVSHPNVEPLRRLLRFGGVDFIEFLHSLDDLPDRTRLAVPDLQLPALELLEDGPNAFRLRCGAGLPGFSHVMLGVLRTMADDYGALVFLDRAAAPDGTENLSIRLVKTAYSSGRSFDLGAGMGA